MSPVVAPVFLDLDGTLTDPKPGITGAVIAALTRLDLPAPSADELEWVIGPALLDSFRKLGAPDPDAALAIYREVYAAEGMLSCHVYPGIPEALEVLKSAGHRLVLVTAKPWVFAVQITAHFGLDRWLDAQFGPDLDGRLNDKRDLLAHVMSDQGVSGGVMVGDRSYDIEAARATGAKALAVTWGYGSAAEHAAADALCHSADALPGAVLSLLAD